MYWGKVSLKDKESGLTWTRYTNGHHKKRPIHKSGTPHSVKYHILQYWLNQGRMYAHLHVIQHYFTVTEWGWHLSSPNTCTMQCAQNLLSASSKCLLRLGSKSLLSNKTKCFWSGFIPSTIHHLNSEGMTAVLGTTSFGLMLLYMCVCVCVWIMI